MAVLVSKFITLPEGVGGMITDDLPLYFFLFVFFVTVFLGFVTAPYSIYKEEREKAFLLEKAREPKMKVFVGEVSGSREYTAHTAQTIGGNRYTSLAGSTSNGLSLVVKNTGETRVDKCTANLVWLECVEGDSIGQIELFEPIRLPWSHTDTEENLETSIDPSASCRVWIADVNYKGWAWLMRDTNKLPANYQQIFGSAGTYRAIIQVSDGLSLSIETKVEITSSESKANETYPSGTGKAKISILEQDYQRLLPPNIAT